MSFGFNRLGNASCRSLFEFAMTRLLAVTTLLTALGLLAEPVLRSGADQVSGTLTLPPLYASDIYENSN